jgi:hypothetical protein
MTPRIAEERTTPMTFSGCQEPFIGDRKSDHENHKGNQDALFGEEPANVRLTETTSHRFLPPIRKCPQRDKHAAAFAKPCSDQCHPPSIMTTWPVM